MEVQGNTVPTSDDWYVQRRYAHEFTHNTHTHTQTHTQTYIYVYREKQILTLDNQGPQIEQCKWNVHCAN